MRVPAFWREQGPRYRLEGTTCFNCGANLFPPRDVCPYCEGRALSPELFPAPSKLPPVVGAAVARELAEKEAAR